MTIPRTIKYPVILWRFNDNSNLVDELAQMPFRQRLNGVNSYYVFAPRGWAWSIKVDSKRSELFDRYALKKNNAITIINKGDFSQSSERISIYDVLKKNMSEK